MTATINLSLNVPHTYDIALLKEQLTEYAKHLVAIPRTPSKPLAAQRKIAISSKIRRMSGRYPVPDNLDYKELRACEMEAAYNAQQAE